MGIVHYHTGCNVPGYLPMNDEPAYAFSTFDAAKRDLIDTMLRDADSAAMVEDGEDYATELTNTAEDVNLWSGPDSINVEDDRKIHDLGVSYWVVECLEAECLEDEDNSDINWPEPAANTSEGWICGDCLQLLANGETPVDMNEEDTAAYMERVSAGQEGCKSPFVTLGRLAGLHGCGEPHEWDDEEHQTGCEVIEFSWSVCDLCRRDRQAGSRYAATFWLED